MKLHQERSAINGISCQVYQLFKHLYQFSFEPNIIVCVPSWLFLIFSIHLEQSHDNGQGVVQNMIVCFIAAQNCGKQCTSAVLLLTENNYDCWDGVVCCRNVIDMINHTNVLQCSWITTVACTIKKCAV